MIDHIPIGLNIAMLFATIFTMFFYYYSNKDSGKFLFFVGIWGIIHSIIAFTGFYQNTEPFPPRILFVLIPLILALIFGLIPNQRNWVVQRRNLKRSPFLHSVRIVAELMLFGLFVNKMIPELMTFEGRNHDIFAGITAIVVGVLFAKNFIGHRFMLFWNIIGLGMILFIFGNAILSSETPLQQFAFDQPNRALLYFPFILLPSIVVPLVIYTHIIDIIKHLRIIKNNE